MLNFYEIHPGVVQSPLALFPVSIACDTAGMLRDDDALLSIGKLLVSATAFRAITVALAAFIDDQAAHANERNDLMVRHRNVNVGLVILTAGLAWQQHRRKRPSVAYMLGAFGGLSAMAYTAYLRRKIAIET